MPDTALHRYRSHTCGALRATDIGSTSGCPAGCTASATTAACCSSTFATITALPRSSPIPTARPSRLPRRCAPNGSSASTARCAQRPEGTVNADLPTGAIEVFATEIEVLSSQAKELPVPVFGEPDYPEDLRLTYRFLDLRRETLHAIIMKRLAINALHPPRAWTTPASTSSRRPILTASSPEGARDFLVPSPHPSGQVLRPAAGPAAVQAAADDVGLRPLLPDRALLPRRGPARRPPAGRVLPARRRNELRRAGRRVLHHGADHARRVRRIC